MPIELKVLKPDGKMTEKKLKKHTALGTTSFLLSYKLTDLLGYEGQALTKVSTDVIAAAVPSGFYLKSFEVKPFAIGKQGKLELLIDAKIVPHEIPPPPAEPMTATGEEPSTPVADAELPLELPTDTSEPAEIPATEPCSMPEGNDDDTVLVNEKEYVPSPVHAELVSDDHVQKAEFDCQDWFKQATDEDILELAREGYSHDFTSDNVAQFFNDKNDEVKQVFTYLDSIKNVPSKKDVQGFGCTVDEDQAINWVEHNRPHLMEKLAVIKDGEEAKCDE
jgi:hypothetical protein